MVMLNVQFSFNVHPSEYGFRVPDVFFLPSRFISHAVFNIHICSVEVNDVVQPHAPSPSLTTPLLPSPQKLPQYYDVIKQPMDLKMVAQRIQASEYNSLAELEADLQLVFRNACTFNEPGSQIYKDAKVLRKLAQTRRAEIEHARLTAAKSSERIRSVSRAGGLLSQSEPDGDHHVEHVRTIVDGTASFFCVKHF